MATAAEHPLKSIFDRYPFLHRLIVLSFLIYVICLFGLAALVLRDGISVETDIQAIVPQNSDPVIKVANHVLEQRFGNIVMLVLAGTDKQKVRECEKILREELSKRQQLKVRNDREIIESYQELIKVYQPYQFTLLSESDRRLLRSNRSEKIIQAAWRRLLSFQTGHPVSHFAKDPLGIFDNYYNGLPFMRGIPGIDAEGFVEVITDDGVVSYARPIVIEVNGKAMDMTAQNELVSYFDAVQQSAQSRYDRVEFYRTGLIFHAENAAVKAKKEFTFISLASMLGIVLLFLVCFASVRPLLLSILSLLFGFAAAATVCCYFFPRLHLITLVFGASLIGVVIDYSLHYFSHMENIDASDRLATLKRIFPSIVMGVVTTVVGYACLYQASLPGLREIATFCIVGLVSAWLFVTCAYPWLAGKRAIYFPGFIYQAAELPERFWSKLGGRRSLIFVSVVFIAAAAIWFIYGKAENDIRLFYKPPPELMTQDIKIRSMFSQQAANQYFLVKGVSAQDLLQNEEQLVNELQRQVRSGVLDSFTALSQYIPSIELQKGDYLLLSKTLYAHGGELEKFILQAGIEKEFLEIFLKSQSLAELRHLEPEDVLTHMPQEIRDLWLGEQNGLFYSMVFLGGINSLEPLSNIADNNESVTFVDRVQSLSELLKRQYWQAIILLIAGYAVIGLIVITRYRRIESLSIVLVPMISSFLLLGILSLLSVSIGLFHILALYLALGLGLDYGIFLYDSPADRKTMVAVMLSALTSSLSFGLLSLSSTPMISAFGLTVLGSGILSLLLAPLLIKAGREPNVPVDSETSSV
ncbi:MAG: MMPL family transporter [Gammaproteobacteria bacterium]|nr:MMPL family transporter [Gammaproteobacteria bacterium]